MIRIEFDPQWQDAKGKYTKGYWFRQSPNGDLQLHITSIGVVVIPHEMLKEDWVVKSERVDAKGKHKIDGAYERTWLEKGDEQ